MDCHAILTHRHNTLDLMRAVAIVLMVIFHFFYDLKFFGFADISIPDSTGWRAFRAIIMSLFLLGVGASLVMAYPAQIAVKKYCYRLAKLALAALLVTVISLLVVPENWIFFGILHFIFVASLICIWFRRWPRISFAIGIAILSFHLLLELPKRFPFHFWSQYQPDYTNDFVYIVPWLALPFLGIWLAYQAWFLQNRLVNLKVPYGVTFLSRHSLLIYLLHQPVLFALLAGVKRVD